MPLHVILMVISESRILGNQWYTNFGHDNRSPKLSQKSRSANVNGLAKSTNIKKRDSPGDMTFQSTSSQNSSVPKNILVSGAVSSAIPSPISNFTISSSSKQYNITIIIIAVITIVVLISLSFIIFLFCRRRKTKKIKSPVVTKEFLLKYRSLSIDSSLPNQSRISIDANEYSTALSRELSTSTDDVPFSDIEKELMVEPPLIRHPVFKSIDLYSDPPHPGTRVDKPEIPSQPLLPTEYKEKLRGNFDMSSSKEISTVTVPKILKQNYQPPDTNSLLRCSESLSQDVCSNYVSRNLTSSNEFSKSRMDSRISLRNKFHVIEEEENEMSILEDSVEYEDLRVLKYPWIDLNSTISQPGTFEMKSKNLNQDTNFISSTKRKKTSPFTQDDIDEARLISDHCPESAQESSLPLINPASDCYIPGAWISFTGQNESSIQASESDITDMSENVESQAEITSTSTLNSFKNIITESKIESDLSDHNESETFNINTKVRKDPEIQSFKSKIWRKWSKR